MSREIELLEKQLAFWKHHAASLTKALDEAEQTATRYSQLLDKTEEELNAERVKSDGEWIDADPDGHLYRFTCSLCEKTKLGKGTPYCPYCGAKMKGGA